MCRPPPPLLSIRMVIDNITTTSTRHCLNDIWMYRSKNILKSFLPFSVQSSHRDCPNSPPPPYPTVKWIVLIRHWFSSILGHCILFLFLISVSFNFSSEMTDYKWGMFCVNKLKREREREIYDFWHAISYILLK